MNLPWLTPLQEATRQAAVEAIAAQPRVQMRGYVFLCVDPLCDSACYGRVPYKIQRVLGGSLNARNAKLAQARLEYDAKRARQQGQRLLAICETHRDCKFREKHSLMENDVWAAFQEVCAPLKNTVAVWVSRNEKTGAVTLNGPLGKSVGSEMFAGTPVINITMKLLNHYLRQAGFSGDDVLHDLSYCLLGNLRRPRQAPPTPATVGIIVGSGFAGTRSHFGITDRVERLPDALELATQVLQERQGSVPYVAVVIPRHPQRIQTKSQVYDAALRNLKLRVTAELNRLRLRCPVVPLFATKCTGDLHLVKI